MFKSGHFVSKHVTEIDGSKVPEKQVQPNGVELTVDKIFRCDGPTFIGDEEYEKAPRTEATLTEPGNYVIGGSGANHKSYSIKEFNEDSLRDQPNAVLEKPHYTLIQGPYVVRYNEKIEVPEDHVGYVFPRSRLIRSGNHLTTAVWDSGYEGRGEGGLHINSLSFIEQGMRIGQFVLARANTISKYDGQHQGESIDE